MKQTINRSFRIDETMWSDLNYCVSIINLQGGDYTNRSNFIREALQEHIDKTKAQYKDFKNERK